MWAQQAVQGSQGGIGKPKLRAGLGPSPHANATSALTPYSQLALRTIVFHPWHVSGMLMTAILEGSET